MVRLQDLPRDFLYTRLAPKLDVPDLARMVQSYKEPLWREAFETQQAKMREDLGEALAASRKGYPKRADCWCWLHPPADQAEDECQKREGTLARIVQRCGDYTVYRSLDSFLQFDPQLMGAYLIHDDYSRVRWVGFGLNAGGAWLHGADLEMEAMYPG